MTLNFVVWPPKIIRHLFYTTSSFVYQFKSIGWFKRKLQSGNAQFGSKSAISCSVWPWNLMGDLGKQWAISSVLHQALCIISNPSVNWNWSYSPETLNSGQNRRFFVLCDLEIWWMTLENNRARLLYYTKLCASFQIYRWIQIRVTVRKRSIWVKICNFFVPCDLEIWRMTLKNNRAPLLCCFKLCASFHSHQGIQAGVTVRKRTVLVKIDNFLAVWPWNLMDDLKKQ